MSEQIKSQVRRPLWRRLLRYAGFTLGGLAGLLLVLLLALIAVNWNDEELTPEAQAWLLEPPNPVADADNAWLAMIAIGVEKQPGTAVGRQMLERRKWTPRLYGKEEAFLKEFGSVWQADAIDTGICSIRENGPDILPSILARQEELQKLVAQQRPALARYYAAISLRGFHEEEAVDETSIAPVIILNKAACLARIDLALRLMAGDRTADKLFVQHLRYSLTAFEQSPSLISAISAKNTFQVDQALLQGLLAEKPVAAKRILETLHESLQAYVDLSQTSIQHRLLSGELRIQRRIIRGTDADAFLGAAEDEGTPMWLSKAAYHLLYKPQASLNLQRKIMGRAELNSAEVDEDCERYKLSAYNTIGKMLICTVTPNYKYDLTRIRQAQDEAAKLLAQILPAAEVSR